MACTGGSRAFSHGALIMWASANLLAELCLTADWIFGSVDNEAVDRILIIGRTESKCPVTNCKVGRISLAAGTKRIDGSLNNSRFLGVELMTSRQLRVLGNHNSSLSEVRTRTACHGDTSIILGVMQIGQAIGNCSVV